MAIKQITSMPSISPEGKSIAKIREIRGNTLVWNQLVKNGNFANGVTNWTIRQINGVISTADGITMLCDNTDSIFPAAIQTVDIQTGHKYFVSFSAKKNDCAISAVSFYFGNSWAPITSPSSRINVTTAWGTKAAIIVCPDNANSIILSPWNYTNNNDEQWSLKNVILIDLTLMFGKGNEPSTVEEFEAMFPENYYKYNSGEIINSNINAIEAVGFNQWDEEWEVGTFDSVDGELLDKPNSYAVGKIRSKNFIPVFPSTQYYITKSNVMYWEYDENKNYIQYLSYRGKTPNNGLFTTSSTCRYIRFRISETSETYQNDTCINLSDSNKNGTYEPYKKSSLHLNISTLTGKLNGEGESVTICPEGLKSVGSVYDEGIVENGFMTKIVKRVGSVDLGTLTWTRTTSTLYGGEWSFFWTKDYNFKKPVIGTIATICDIYEGIPVYSFSSTSCKMWTTDRTCMPYTDSVFYVRDDSYTDAETFKAAMSGVELVYELATPLEYVLDTPVLMEYNTDGGTEQIVFSENLLSTPLVADVDYFNTAIKHIQFSDETHCIRDERITGVDYIPTEHSTNVVTSAGVYNAVNNVDHLVPLQSKTWTSTWYSESQYTGHYFMKVRPTDWNKIAVLKYRIRCSIQNVAGSGCDSIVTYQFAKGATPVYYTYNARVDSTKLAFSAHYVYVLNETGFNAINTAGHILGVKIDGTSYQWSSAYRVFTIDILYCDNCTVTFYDSDSNASIRENANYYSGIAISSAIGLQKTGDANSTYANYSFGNSYGICTTVEETLAKTSAISNYILTQGAVTTIYFENAVPASSTLNVNTRGAKPIYYKNEPITNNIIKAGDTATFRYTSDVLSSGAYMLVALDRDFNDFVVAKALNDLESTKEDLEHKVTSLTPFSTDIQYPSAKAVYDHINTQLTSVLNAAQTAAYNEIHPKIGTTQPQDGFEPNVVYDLGTITGSVTFALVSPTDNTITNPYHWTFETGSTAPTITWPNGLTWAGGIAPTIAASKHYEVLVRNGYANVLEF